MTGNRIERSRADLERQLAEQMAFLRASAVAFDAGYRGEAKRMATAVRVLLHDTKNSVSLLKQLNLKGIAFFDTAHDVSPTNLLTHMGLVGMRMDTANGASYAALLGNSPSGEGRPIPFSRWWDKVVFVDNKRSTMTRAQLVLTLANKDGGAHVDPTLDEMYVRLSRENSMGWVAVGPDGEKAMEDVHLVAMRQIAFEVETSLGKRAALRPWGDDARTEVPSAPGRNHPCPCGSGRKYKKCHGAAA